MIAIGKVLGYALVLKWEKVRTIGAGELNATNTVPATLENQKLPKVTGAPPPKEPYFTFEQVREAAIGKVLGYADEHRSGDAGDRNSP
jgi:hypothetical protein